MTTSFPARIGYAVAKARHRARRARHRGAPVVVFSMAKTGSTAVADALRAAGVGDVYHVHDLDRDFLREEEQQYRWSGRPWRIWDAQRLLDRPPTPSAPWHVVSIVRDPIAQAVSAFFQPGARRGYLDAATTVDDLLVRFGDRLDHTPMRWLETHVEPALGIDVYAHPFDLDRGYQIISTDTVRLLLLRCEHLDVGPAALADLLGRDAPIVIPRSNVATDKEHAALYAAFVERLRPTAAQIERACSSRLVQHFYSPPEIDQFRSRWSTRGAPHSPAP